MQPPAAVEELLAHSGSQSELYKTQQKADGPHRTRPKLSKSGGARWPRPGSPRAGKVQAARWGPLRAQRAAAASRT